MAVLTMMMQVNVEMWNLPYNTHKIFIEALGGPYAQMLIYAKYINFIQNIRKSDKLTVIYLLEKIHLDQNTVTGKNINHVVNLSDKTDIFKIDHKSFKKSFKFEKLPQDQNWKVNLIKEITDINHKALVIGEENDKMQFTEDELNEIKNFVATF